MWNCDGVCMLLGVAWWWWYIAIWVITSLVFTWAICEDDDSEFSIYLLGATLGLFIGAFWPITIPIILLALPRWIANNR